MILTKRIYHIVKSHSIICGFDALLSAALSETNLFWSFDIICVNNYN